MNLDGTLTVVVPTLDEAECLPDLLDDLEPLGADIVVVDGGSSDGTAAVAREGGARVVSTSPGRGRQLQAGAEAASGDWLFFVHADCRFDGDAVTALRDFLATAHDDDFGHFRFELDGDGWIHRFIELGQGLRERGFGLVYGDQGLIVSRSLHDRVSGHPVWPVMEDVGMIQRLERHGRRVALPATLLASARRYDEEGGLRRWARNVALMVAFHLGVPPRRLASWYRPRRYAPPAPRASRIVGLFAKVPEPGRVKTRLAADVGDERAARIYRALGRATVNGLRGGRYRTIVYVEPPDRDAIDSVRAWLGSEDVEYRPQPPGDLGERMSEALDDCLAEANEALLVGTDVPDIDRETAEAGFAALGDHDVVIGPATDGGYYLVGVTRSRPTLFRDIAWSTDCVLEQTLARAARMGLSVALLPAKTDVDTVDDLPAELSAPRGHAAPLRCAAEPESPGSEA